MPRIGVPSLWVSVVFPLSHLKRESFPSSLHGFLKNNDISAQRIKGAIYGSFGNDRNQRVCGIN